MSRLGANTSIEALEVLCYDLHGSNDGDNDTLNATQEIFAALQAFFLDQSTILQIDNDTETPSECHKSNTDVLVSKVI
jgi:hypothetical protein